MNYIIGTIVVPTPTQILGIETSTGNPVWSQPFETTAGGGSPVPSPTGEAIYATGGKNGFYLYAFNSSSGNTLWTFKTQNAIQSSPAITPEGHIILGSTDGNLYRLSAEGKLIWTFPTNHFIFTTPAVDSKGFIYVAAYGIGIYCLYPNSTVRWNFAIPQDISGLIGLDEKRQFVVVGTQTTNIWAVNSTTGEQLWMRTFSQPVASPIAIDGHGNIHIGTQDGNYYIFSSGGTMLWNIPLPNSIVASLISKDKLYVLSGGLLYAFEPQAYDDVPWFETEEFIILVSVGVGVALILVVLSVVAVACVVHRVNKKRRINAEVNKELKSKVGLLNRDRGFSSDEEEHLLVEDLSGSYGVLQDLQSHEETFAIAKEWETILQRACKEKWYIPYKGLVLQEKIAVGGVGTIYKARWKGTDVAVKTMTGGFMPLAKFKGEKASSSSVDEFIKEIGLLSTLRHPNIVMFLGATVIPSGGLGYGIVTEFCPLGSLWDVLHDSTIRFDWSTIIKLANGIASGMNYLHCHPVPILHRDLKSPNVLVLNDLTPRITDFGLSKFRPEDNSKSLTFQIGSPFWMPPEMMTGVRYTEKADVYSFGIILWEILTREEPFKDTPLFKIYSVVTSGERPKIPSWCPENFSALINRCWAHQQDQRPFFSEVIEMLQHCEDEGEDLVLPLPPPEGGFLESNNSTREERGYPATSRERRERSAGSILGTSFEKPSGFAQRGKGKNRHEDEEDW